MAEGTGNEEAFAKMEEIALLNPRGWYTIEFHNPFLLLQGKVSNLKIQYTSIKHLYMLTESSKRTMVVVKINPPAQERETLYSHIVIQFDSKKMIHNIRASSSSGIKYTGLVHDVFTTIVEGLTKAAVTKGSKFRGYKGSYALESYFEERYGLLYPLAISFFFVPKPATRILHKEICYVEFRKHEAGEYFDILIGLKSEAERIFRNIKLEEYQNLFKFLSSKGLDVRDSQIKVSGVPVLHLESIENEASGDESDEEDPDFVSNGYEDDGGSPTDDSGGEDFDDNKSLKKKPKLEPSAPEASSSAKKTAFMLFSELERKNLSESNPALSFLDVSLVLEKKWRSLTVEEKVPYINMTQADSTSHISHIVQDNDNDAVDTHLPCIENESGGGFERDDEEDDIACDEAAFDVLFDREDTDVSDGGDENVRKYLNKILQAESCAKKTEDGSKKRKQMVKDFSERKQGTSAFMFFSQSKRKKLAKSNPRCTYKEISMVIEERWKNLSAIAKQRYEARARADARAIR